jgi:hypothetical protein
MNKALNQSRKRQKGSLFVEFVLVVALVMVPLLLGTLVVGFNLIRSIQVNQVNRDAGHMYARGVDFSSDTNGLADRAILFQMAPKLTVTTSSGVEVLILSSIEYVGSTTCSGCANLGHAVFTQQITLGNKALRASVFGTVSASSMLSDGTGNVINPLTDTSVRADPILTILPSMADNQIAYVSETFYNSVDLSIPGYMNTSGVYARAIF